MNQHTPHTLFLNHTHMHTDPRAVSEGLSSSTFPLHQFLFYAASASPGLPGLTAARDLLTCSFVADLSVFACACICSQVRQRLPTDMLLLCLTCSKKFFHCLLCIQLRLLSNPYSTIKLVRAVIRMLLHEALVFIFYDDKPERQVFVTAYQFNTM